MVSYCRGCGAEIEWKEIQTRNGPKQHPFNPGTNTSHFKTCPKADDFRTKVNVSYAGQYHRLPEKEEPKGLEEWM